MKGYCEEKHGQYGMIREKYVEDMNFLRNKMYLI